MFLWSIASFNQRQRQNHMSHVTMLQCNGTFKWKLSEWLADKSQPLTHLHASTERIEGANRAWILHCLQSGKPWQSWNLTESSRPVALHLGCGQIHQGCCGRKLRRWRLHEDPGRKMEKKIIQRAYSIHSVSIFSSRNYTTVLGRLL